VAAGSSNEIVIMEGSARCIRDALISLITQIDALAKIQVDKGELARSWSEGEVLQPCCREIKRTRAPR
jgi:hypothetical protein